MSACQLQRAEGRTLIVSAKAQGIWEHRRLLRPTTEAALSTSHTPGPTMSEINRNHVSFIAFLHHLVDEHDFSPSYVVAVVEKPWKWQAEFEKFLAGEEIEI